MRPLPGPRVAWSEGARLTAADLALHVDRERRFRGLHARVVHDTWGVAIALDVTVASGGRGVTVAPGLAYDACGGEVHLPAAVDVPAPDPPGPGAWWVDLVASQGPRVRLAVAGPVAGGGWPPELAPDVLRGREVPLARLRLSAGGTLSEPDSSGRPTARRLPRPRVGGGRIAAGGAQVSGTPAAWTLRVDTSAAAFQRAPHYAVTLADLPTGPARLGPFTAIRDPEPGGFLLDVRLGAGGALAAAELRGASFPLPAGLAWIGVEPLPPPKGGSPT